MLHPGEHKAVEIRETVGAYKAIAAARVAARDSEQKKKNKDKPLTPHRGLDLVRARVRAIERPQRVTFRCRGSATAMSAWQPTPNKSS